MPIRGIEPRIQLNSESETWRDKVSLRQMLSDGSGTYLSTTKASNDSFV